MAIGGHLYLLKQKKFFAYIKSINLFNYSVVK